MERICDAGCVCAYCDAPETCENARCEKRCTGGDRAKDECSNFMTWRVKDGE